MGRGERGQIAMEYLLVTGFAFLLLLPIIIIAYQQSATYVDDVTSAQIQKVGNEIINAANTVYYSGPPTKKTVRVYFPKNIYSVEFKNTAIVFTAQGQGGAYEYAVVADTNMTGNISTFDGIHVLTVEAKKNVVNITES